MTIYNTIFHANKEYVQTKYEFECYQFLSLMTVYCMTTVQHFLSCKQNMSRQNMKSRKKHWLMQLTINVPTVDGRTKKSETTMKQLLMHIIYTYVVEKYDFGLIIKLPTHCQHTVQ